MGWGRGRLASIVAASLVLAVAIAGAATDANASGEGPVSAETSVGLPWFNFSFSPKLLSHAEPSPARLDLGFAFERGGIRPPALSPVSVELDKHIALEGTGIPVCGGLGVQGGVEPATDCKESIVGRGKETFAIAFPEEEPQRVSGPVVVYYGGVRNGVTRLHAFGYLGPPTSSSFDIEIDLEHISDGRFGTEVNFSVPMFAGGDGSIAALELSLFKRFADRGHRRSFVSATCPDGRLEAVAAAFQSPPLDVEGPLEEAGVRACTVRR